MKTKIQIEGKEYEVELTPEQLKSIEEQSKPKHTGYERKIKQDYYFITSDRNTGLTPVHSVDSNNKVDEGFYINGNYFNSTGIVLSRERLFNTLNIMYRWAAENTATVHFEEIPGFKYSPAYDSTKEKIIVDEHCNLKVTILPIFLSKNECKKFIEMFNDELMWLFTEFTYRVGDAE